MTPTQHDASRISRQAGARRRFPRNRMGVLFFFSGLFPCFFPALMLIFQLVSPRTGWTVEEEDNGVEELFMGTSLELPDWLRTPDGYVFRPEGKPDPFRPFVRPAPPEELFRTQVPTRALTPLERVEASQLRVIGIVWAADRPDQALAMVEMPDGKGFVLRPGVGVGRYGGKVRRITANEVIIEEHGLDIAGREQVREVILKLHPSEGDGHG